MTHTVAKLQTWSTVRSHLEVLIRNLDPEDVAVMLPYGLQLVHTFHHPHVLRCMAFNHSTSGNIFISHIDSGAGNIMYTWTVSSLDELKVDCQKFQVNTAVINLLSIPRHRVFIGYCTDMTLCVLSDIIHKCVELSRTATPVSVLCMTYNEEMDELITGGHGCLQTWKMEHVELRDPLTPGRGINCDISPEDWVRDIKVFQKQKQVVVLCNEGVFMVDYLTNQQLFHMQNWHDTALTSFVWYRPLEYFITASMDGTIKVWNAIVFSQVHEFIGHYNCVTGLVTHPTDPLLVSSSKDGTLRVWRLDTFQLTQRIDVAEEILGMRFSYGNQLYYYTLHDIKVWNFNQFHHLFTPIQSCIHKLARIKSERMPSRILCAAEDGSVRLISAVSGSVLTIIYPMATYQIHTDIVYDPLSHCIYTALNSGDILVFDTSTNPCRARELWVPPIPDESILCLALVKLDCALGMKETLTCESLIFAGHNSGQISLLEAQRRCMKDTVQGHCGAILALECSHGSLDGGVLDSGSDVGSSDRLLSCGSDKKVQIWKIHAVSDFEITLLSLCSIPCLACPSHVSMLSNSLCMALPLNNTIFVFEIVPSGKEVSKEALKMKSHDIRLYKHLKDHDHTQPITGLCCCPSIGLFASASIDGSVKVWDRTNTLIRELCFDPSLRGVCFANDHGDILVGFQNHVSYVNATSYLPYHYLEKLLSLNFVDEQKEEPLPFNPEHQLWFDLSSLPAYPTHLQARHLYAKKLSLYLKEGTTEVETLDHTASLVESSTSTEMSPSLTGSDSSSPREVSQKDFHHIMSTESFLETQSSEQYHEPHLSVTADVSLSRHESTLSPDSALTSESSLQEPKYVWPIAPDGYIPNSVLRSLMGYQRPPTPPPPSRWVLKMLFLEDSSEPEIEQTYESHEPFTWASSSEESLKVESPVSMEDETGGSPFILTPVSPRVTPRTPMRQSVEDQKLQLKSLKLPSMLVIPTFEPTEGIEKSSRGKKKGRRGRGINITAGTIPRRSRRQSKALGGVTEESEESYDESDFEEEDGLLQRLAQEKWFPSDVSLNVEDVIRALMMLLETTRDAQYRTICNAVVDIYGEYGFSDILKRDVEAFFEHKLKSPRGVVRASAVYVLTKLGANRRDVILKLIPKLVDEEIAVRQEAVTAVKTLAGIQTKQDLENYLTNVGLLQPYRNQDTTILRDLSNRYASAPLPKLSKLQASLQGHVVTHRMVQARRRKDFYIDDGRGGTGYQIKSTSTTRGISEWETGILPSSTKSVGRRIVKKQKKEVRPLRRKPQVQAEVECESIEERDIHEDGYVEEVSDFESELDYQSSEENTQVRFTIESLHDIPEVKSGRAQFRRQTIHATMLEAKAEMLAQEKVAMVRQMKEKLRRHRERYEKLMQDISKRTLQRHQILPVNPFFWKFYKVDLPSSDRSDSDESSASSLEAQASESDFSVTNEYSEDAKWGEGTWIDESQILDQVTEANKPELDATIQTDYCALQMRGTPVESGVGESLIASTVKVSDVDGRTLETLDSSGVYTDSLIEGIYGNEKFSQAHHRSLSGGKRTKVPSKSLTVANVQKHEHLSARENRKTMLKKRKERLKEAEHAVGLWRKFLEEQGLQKKHVSVSPQADIKRPVVLPCIPRDTKLTSQGGNQRLLYSVSAGYCKSELKTKSHERFFGSTEFGNLSMKWTELSPASNQTSHPVGPPSILPPLRTNYRRREVMEDREWLTPQLLYPSLMKMNSLKTYNKRIHLGSFQHSDKGLMYEWTKPNAIVLPAIPFSNMVEVDNSSAWKKLAADAEQTTKGPTSRRDFQQLPFTSYEARNMPIVPRNSTVSSTQIPQSIKKLKASC